ncbi:MAG: hypothetical protein NZ583_03780 [Desulfobacterota bacterium]|nr:hypothetical protein [Thermodesulfobacteriota bacterium]MDW8002005.1 hypothetical protein [Deltaproteobacteria bacterium]
MTKKEELFEKAKKVLEELKPKLDELAEGYAEVIDVDENEMKVKVRLIGGRLH